MGLFMVDRSKCKKDGICASECPVRIIQMAGEDGFPAMMAEAFCINCGHCISVCPQGAITLKNIRPEELVAVQDSLLPGPEQAAHFLSSRRSIRNYKDKVVDREVLEKIIRVAGYAPSGHNTQPVEWLVVENPGEVRRLSGLVVDWMRLMIKEKPEFARPMHMDMVVAGWEMGMDPVCRQAPHVVVAHAPSKAPTSHDACITALTYLELAAYSMGLGACWAGYFGVAAAVFPPLIEALGLPEGRRVFGAMLLGYPKFKYYRIPVRKSPVITWK
ncbi:MAG: nitroreductase family protein [Bacillota bacterium]